MSDVKRCAACGKENPVSEMKVCMHHQMHRYVCDSKCMSDTFRAERDRLAELLRMVRQDGWYHPLEDHEIAQIDATLAEVKPCPESPAPTT